MAKLVARLLDQLSGIESRHKNTIKATKAEERPTQPPKNIYLKKVIE
jgi:hypothetical protein